MSQNDLKDLDDFFTGTFEKRPPAMMWGKVNPGERYVKGTWEHGTIISVGSEQKYKWLNGKPIEALFWKDGTERKQGVVIVQTDRVGVLGPEDDGRRTFYIDGAMKKAVGDAIKETGAPGLRPGGKLAIQNTGMVKDGEFMVYTWFAKYVPPAPEADAFFADEGEGEPTNHRGEPQPANPPDWAAEEPANVGRQPSTLEKIRQNTAAHQAQLKPNPGFEDEPPF